MRTISHWGMFGDYGREIALPPFKVVSEIISWSGHRGPFDYDSSQQDYRLYFNEIPKQKI